MLWDFVQGFFVLILGTYYKIYTTIKGFATKLSTPFLWVWEKITEFFEEKMPIPRELDRKFIDFNGFMSFLLFCLILAFTAVSTVLQLRSGWTTEAYLTELLYNTTLGFFFDVGQNGLNVTPGSMVAIAVGGLVFSASYSTLREAMWYVKIPGFVLYFVMSANLALLLTGCFNSAGDWLTATVMHVTEQLDQAQGLSWEAFGYFLAAIPLLYVLLLLLSITLQEYLECFFLGLLGILALFLFGLLADWLLGLMGASAQVYAITQQAALVAAVFGLELLRDPLLEWVDDF